MSQRHVVFTQVLHSLGKERLELVNSMTDYVAERVVPILKPVDKCWQPADFLPKPESDSFIDEVRPCQDGCAGLQGMPVVQQMSIGVEI